VTSNYQLEIRKLLLERAARLYPNQPQLQLIYQIGFLQAQLAEAMCDDSRIRSRFRASVNRDQL